MRACVRACVCMCVCVCVCVCGWSTDPARSLLAFPTTSTLFDGLTRLRLPLLVNLRQTCCSMQAKACHCDLQPVVCSRHHAFLPISRLRLQQSVRHPNRAVDNHRKTACTTTQCRSAQPGLDAGASSSGPRQQANTRGPIAADGRDVYWPQSFKEITEDAVKAVLAAIEKGHRRMEVEFPPLPTSDSKQQLP